MPLPCVPRISSMRPATSGQRPWSSATSCNEARMRSNRSAWSLIETSPNGEDKRLGRVRVSPTLGRDGGPCRRGSGGLTRQEAPEGRRCVVTALRCVRLLPRPRDARTGSRLGCRSEWTADLFRPCRTEDGACLPRVPSGRPGGRDDDTTRCLAEANAVRTMPWRGIQAEWLARPTRFVGAAPWNPMSVLQPSNRPEAGPRLFLR